ncbi:MAG: glycoside hydrolase family 10 protein [Butyricicoccus sp.]
MKRLLLLAALFLAAVGFLVYDSRTDAPLVPFAVSDDSAAKTEEEDNSSTDVHDLSGALWVATAYNIDYPSAQTDSVSQLKQECRDILDNADKAGIETIYLQVRPACDALYDSDLFPWSSCLTGTAGKAPSNGFDPLRYWVKQAHKRGMRLEAWVNPYRICAGSNASETFSSLPKSSPAKQHPDWVVQYDGGYYFDPGIPEVRQLIADGVQEIVEQYRVDGIQFDDYFYPGEDFDDEDTYAAYGKAFSDKSDWRRDNVNQLVQTVDQVVHEGAKQEECVFGISPSGIWKNGYGGETGSKTRGFEHYSQCYADSVTWIRNGWVDYICPQIYWEIGNDAADFEELVGWWSDIVRGTDVELIVGLAAYKIGDAENGTVWETDGLSEISRQLKLCQTTSRVSGVAVFSCRDVMQSASLRKRLSKRLT